MFAPFVVDRLDVDTNALVLLMCGLCQRLSCDKMLLSSGIGHWLDPFYCRNRRGDCTFTTECSDEEEHPG